MNRRDFLKHSSLAGGALLASPLISAVSAIPTPSKMAHVAFVKTTDRAAGVKKAIELLGVPRLHGKDIFIKPNFNSADSPPGSTHNDTLAALIRGLKSLNAGPLTLGDRSGM